mgnify:CR=1 FL=1
MKKNRGFSLIELVMVVALIGIFIAVIFSPIGFSLRNFKAQNEKANIISDRRALMDYLTREIRRSEVVDIIDDTLIIDSRVYRIEEGIFLKDDERIMDGIDGWIIDRIGETINIEIKSIDSKGKEYSISSSINIR